MMLKDRVVLVTSGASGIGRITATLAVSAKQRAFGATGTTVVFYDRPDVEGEVLKSVKSEGISLESRSMGEE
ncbi:MAG: hypothetical protein ACM37W_28450 [Actinomycetota bacterium]